MRLWGGRFAEENDQRVADFTRSIELDRELAADDIAGSIAHVRALGRAGLLTDDEVAELVGGLEGLASEVAAGSLTWEPDLEDVHLNLESALADRIGPVAGKLQTGRSRNDQVATDLRLWSRRAIDRLDEALLGFESALVALAEREGTAILPGTTHIQPAQPVLFAHHLLAYVEMAERDRSRLADARRRVNVSPLGSGPLAGAGFPLDREATALARRIAELGEGEEASVYRMSWWSDRMLGWAMSHPSLARMWITRPSTGYELSVTIASAGEDVRPPDGSVSAVPSASPSARVRSESGSRPGAPTASGCDTPGRPSPKQTRSASSSSTSASRATIRSTTPGTSTFPSSKV